jgi:hypothetical protein
VYFSAHPVDGLLYQNPDLFHDLYVYRCVTTVIFTAADRGMTGNFSRNLKNGLEAAYAHMVGVPTNGTAWAESSVNFGKHNVTVRFLKDAPSIQIFYLRLSDGDSDGNGYNMTGRASLKKLYNKDVKFITTSDGSMSYTLESLKDLVCTVLKQRTPHEIRLLDFKTRMPKDHEHDGDHADHVVSARLVVDVVEQNKMEGKVLG